MANGVSFSKCADMVERNVGCALLALSMTEARVPCFCCSVKFADRTARCRSEKQRLTDRYPPCLS